VVRFAESHVYAGDPNVFGVGYDRFAWHHAQPKLVVDVGPGLQPDSLLAIFISKRFLRASDVTRIEPRPLTRTDSGGFVVYGFVREDRRRPAHIVFALKPRTHGTQRGVVALGELTSLPIRQLVLP
jgi:hypothetical protein